MVTQDRYVLTISMDEWYDDALAQSCVDAQHDVDFADEPYVDGRTTNDNDPKLKDKKNKNKINTTTHVDTTQHTDMPVGDDEDGRRRVHTEEQRRVAHPLSPKRHLRFSEGKVAYPPLSISLHTHIYIYIQYMQEVYSHASSLSCRHSLTRHRRLEAR